MDILLLDIIKIVVFLFFFTFVVFFLVCVNDNHIYTIGLNLSLSYLFLLLFKIHCYTYGFVIPYIIVIGVLIGGIYDFDSLEVLIAHIKTIWKSTNYQSLTLKSFISSVEKDLTVNKTKNLFSAYSNYPKFMCGFVGKFIILFLFFSDVLKILFWVFLVGSLYLFAYNYISGALVFIVLSNTLFFIIFISLLGLDPKVKIFIAEWFYYSNKS